MEDLKYIPVSLTYFFKQTQKKVSICKLDCISAYGRTAETPGARFGRLKELRYNKSASET